MQALEGHIDMRWERPWFWPLRKCLVSRGERIPTFIPQANRFAEQFAQLAGGTARSMLPEILFACPAPPTVSGLRHGQFGAITPLWTTATACLGTRICTCATGPWWPRNLGVNPSLTITALAERAMSFIPPEWMTWNDAAEDSR
jgi:cholesterol oxidase